MKRLAPLLFAPAMALLIACGGGGDDEGGRRAGHGDLVDRRDLEGDVLRGGGLPSGAPGCREPERRYDGSAA